MTDSEPNRRKFLRMGSLIFASGVAGCSSQSIPSSDISPTPTRTQTLTLNDTPQPVQAEVDTLKPDLSYLHGITGQTYPPDIDGNHHRRYEWSGVGYEWWFEMNIPRSLGEYYSKRYGRNENYDVYVSDAYGDGYIKNISDKFKNFKEQYDLSERETVDLAVAFVQGMNYTEDEVTSGFNQYTYYPVETLIERGGDCEDSTILLASILRQMGYGVVLLGLWDTKPQQHMALGVKGDESIPGTYYEHNGERYYYVETTGEGWRIGEMPEFDGSTEAEIMEIEPHPTLVYEFETRAEQGEGVHVDATVWNYGDPAGLQTSFYAKFEDRLGNIHAHDEMQIGWIENEGQKPVHLTLHPPENRELRLFTAVIVDKSFHDFARSEWREPV